MGYEDKIAAHMERVTAILEPGEEVILTYYGKYNVRGFGNNPNLSGTWALTSKRLCFTGKAGFSSGWSGMAKSGKVMTIPYPQIAEMVTKKDLIIITHSAEHEGKKPGKYRKVRMGVARLKFSPTTGKKEDKKELIARTTDIYNQIKKLAGLP